MGPTPASTAPLLQAPAPSACSKLPCSELAPARRLWSFGGGVGGGEGLVGGR
jgi:hypothetical protein